MDFRKKKTKKDFKRQYGVTHEVYLMMLNYLEKAEKKLKSKGGKPNKLSVEERLQMTLAYWKEYPTYFSLGKSWGISESACYRNVVWIEENLVKSKLFALPKKSTIMQDKSIKQIVVDATEIPVERPQEKQELYYSGKKKKHTVKAQIIIDLKSAKILQISLTNGANHDFDLCKKTGIPVNKKVEILADSGYQGLQNIHEKSKIPFKKNAIKASPKEKNPSTEN